MTTETHPRPPRGMQPDGLALWSYGFRPFFLGAALVAIAGMGLWILALLGHVAVGGEFGAPLWHAHEMVFGFAPAVLAGFLLTAIPNWTGSLPVAGRPLIGLVAVWLAGRLAMAAAAWTGLGLAAAIDLLFLPLLLAVCGREIIAGRKWSDLKVLAGVAAIMAGNTGFHVALLSGGDPQPWLRAAVAGYVLLVLIIGGRIIPSFTRNWLNQSGQRRFPVPYNRFDTGVIAFSALAMALWTLAPEGRLSGAAALIAAGLNLTRLARWRGHAVRAEGLLLVLHLAYGFVPLGLLAIAAAALGALAPAAALHVLTVGVIATMMLAMMTRVTRGHTGRALVASRLTLLSYVCLFGAALARPLADLLPLPGLIEGSGLLWILAFVLFLSEHAGMLVHARRPPLSAGR